MDQNKFGQAHLLSNILKIWTFSNKSLFVNIYFLTFVRILLANINITLFWILHSMQCILLQIWSKDQSVKKFNGLTAFSHCIWSCNAPKKGLLSTWLGRLFTGTPQKKGDGRIDELSENVTSLPAHQSYSSSELGPAQHQFFYFLFLEISYGNCNQYYISINTGCPKKKGDQLMPQCLLYCTVDVEFRIFIPNSFEN